MTYMVDPLQRNLIVNAVTKQLDLNMLCPYLLNSVTKILIQYAIFNPFRINNGNASEAPL